jgi:VanZ family protein
MEIMPRFIKTPMHQLEKRIALTFSDTIKIKPRPILIILIIFVQFFFFLGKPEEFSPRSFQSAWNLGHIFYYAIVPFAFLTILKKEDIPPRRQILLAFGYAAVIGTLMECFQYTTGRMFDPFDLIRNMIGALVSISFLLPMRALVPKTIKILTIALVLVQLYPFTASVIDEYQTRRDFPILSDFETPFQIQRWMGTANMSIAKDVGAPGNHALRADFTTAKFSSIELEYFQPNWQHYHKFQFQILNPSPEPISITCHVHDAQHTRGPRLFSDRFHKIYTLSQGWNTITIDIKEIQEAPQTRSMDLTQIRGIVIYTTQLPHPRTIYIDNLKLD